MSARPRKTTGSSYGVPSIKFKLNARTIVAPISFILLAGIFFVYSRTTIQAAKVNAKRHREADGGSISWRNEALRRHGVLKKPEERTLLQQLFAGKEDSTQDQDKGDKENNVAVSRRPEINPIEEGIRQAKYRKRSDQDEE